MTPDEAKSESHAAGNQVTTPAQPPKAKNPASVKKAVALGKEIRKQPEKTKAEAAREMFALISDEPRDIIIQAFVDGAGLTPKGARTYFYKCKRKAGRTSQRLARSHIMKVLRGITDAMSVVRSIRLN